MKDQPNLFKVGAASLNQTPLDWKGNVSRIIDAIERAKVEQVKVLCLPELAISAYGCEDLFLSNWLLEKAIIFIPEIVARTKNIFVVFGLPLRFENRLYNVCCIAFDTNILGFYAKQHLANDGVHYETRWFTPWPKEQVKEINFEGSKYPIGDLLLDHQNIKIGFEICEDAWVGDKRPGLRQMRKGVDIILNPSASHFAFGKAKFREELIRSSSALLHCTYVYANLMGNEAGRMVYDGDLYIAQEGTLLQRGLRLSFRDSEMATANVQIDHMDTSSVEHYLPDPKDEYSEFLKAGTLALFDYMRKSCSKGFVLSLSGGADSSTCAVLVSEMLRRSLEQLGLESVLFRLHLENDKLFEQEELVKAKDRVEAAQAKIFARRIAKKIFYTAYQGTKNSGEETLRSAQQLAFDIGATFYHWDIDEEVSGYTQKIEKAIGRTLTWEVDDLTLQNIQARTRAPGIWMLSNINNCLLMTTSNRSEGDVGYCTMDGDTAGSIAPIAAVDKQFVINWLQWAEGAADYPSLQFVNAIQPTAELRPSNRNQTDEKDLMPYDLMVKIERLAIKERLSPLEVYLELRDQLKMNSALLQSYVIKFFKLWSRNQWKRERIAPAFHMGDFNVDPRTWCRFPILSRGYEEELAELQAYRE